MKYTICEMLLWKMMSKPSFEYIKSIHPDWDIKSIKDKSKKRYKTLIKELPEIGSLSKNSLRISLSGGALWFSIYESTPYLIKDEEFGKMCVTCYEDPKIKKMLKGKTPFTKKAQDKKAKRTLKDNMSSDSEFSWSTEFIKGRDENEYTVNYHRCGLCALGRKEGYPNLIPYMCALDVMMIDLKGGVLYRTKTLAKGADYCDFYVCKKGSNWDNEKKKTF